MSARVAIVTLVLVAVSPAPAGAAAWRWPVRGPVLERFAYTAATPFAGGQRRGVTIGAPAGTPVRAACAGSVTFAGAVPRFGEGVTVACGALTASYLLMGSVAVRRGDSVAAGDPLGRLGEYGLRLGARRTGRRWAYVDPLALLGAEPSPEPSPLAPAPRARLGAPRSGPALRPTTIPVSTPAGAPEARAATPLTAWLGLGLLAAGVPALGLGRALRTRRRPAAGRAAYAPSDAA